jgi:hypothetical protein
MSKETRKLPLREAYAFGIASGLETEIEQIRSMPIMWPSDTLQYETSLRCAHIIVLFEKHGIFEEFKTKYWPNGNTECLASTTSSGQRQLLFPINDNYS